MLHQIFLPDGTMLFEGPLSKVIEWLRDKSDEDKAQMQTRGIGRKCTTTDYWLMSGETVVKDGPLLVQNS